MRFFFFLQMLLFPPLFDGIDIDVSTTRIALLVMKSSIIRRRCCSVYTTAIIARSCCAHAAATVLFIVVYCSLVSFSVPHSHSSSYLPAAAAVLLLLDVAVPDRLSSHSRLTILLPPDVNSF